VPRRFVLEGMSNLARRRCLGFAIAIGTALLLPPPLPTALASEASWETETAPAQLEIVISKEAQEMSVYIDGALMQVFPVSTGRAGHRTPSGVFPVVRMHLMAYAPKYDNAPMPHSIFFTRHGHAIHGTGHLDTLGRPASHGCVRLPPEAAAWLYALVQQIGRRSTTIRVM
jgi:lipoprotein-anchoring transpeptidase ErfK/SrfK